MPIDTSIYIEAIKRLSPERAKALAEKMDAMQKRRSSTALLMLSLPLIVLLVLTFIRLLTK